MMTHRGKNSTPAPCYQCLSDDAGWRSRYVSDWLLLGGFAVVAFYLLSGPVAVWAQGLTFALLFAQTLRPIFAARRFARSLLAARIA